MKPLDGMLRDVERLNDIKRWFNCNDEQAAHIKRVCYDEMPQSLDDQVAIVPMLHALLREGDNKKGQTGKTIRKYLRIMGHRGATRKRPRTMADYVPPEVDWRPTEVLPEDYYAL